MTITGLILAGGRATRMGDLDKGLQPLRGIPMVRHVLDRLMPQVSQIAMNANQNLMVYAEFGIPVWPDQLNGFAGPLAGFHAGLSQCLTPYLLTVPCDAPFLPNDLATRLLNALTQQQTQAAIAVTGTGQDRQTHPVICLLKTSLLNHLNDYLRSGKSSVHGWQATLSISEVTIAIDSVGLNVNTLQQLSTLQAPTS